MFALSSNLLSHPRNILTNVALFYCLLLQELSFLSFFYFFFLLFSSPDESLVTQRKKNKMKLNETRILRYINSRWLARNSPKISMFDILCSSIFFFFLSYRMLFCVWLGRVQRKINAKFNVKEGEKKNISSKFRKLGEVYLPRLKKEKNTSKMVDTKIN